MNDRYRFSRQEEKVLLLSMSGQDDKQIAEHLGVGLGTVRTFWKRIRAKSGGGTRAEVIAEFKQFGGEDGTTSDQSLRLLTEVAKREDAERRLTALVQSVSDAIWLFDRDGNCVDANAAARDLTGFTQDELLYTPLSGLIAGDDRICRKDGTTATIDGSLFRSPAGQTVLVAKFDRVGTGNALLEQAIRRARIGQIVVVCPNGAIVFANDRLCDLLDQPAAELAGKRIHDLVSASDRTRLEQTLQRSQTNGEAQCSLSMLHRNGSFVSMFVDVAYLPAQDGAAHQVLAIRRMADAGRLLTPRNSRIG